MKKRRAGSPRVTNHHGEPLHGSPSPQTSDTMNDWTMHDNDPREEDLESDADESAPRVCPDCHGTALSPYPQDGGSCPHCFNGYIR